MGSVIGNAIATVGIGVAGVALLALLHVAGLQTTAIAPELALVAAGAALVGVMVFGYGVGRRTGF